MPSHNRGARDLTGRPCHIFEFSWIVKNASLCTGSCSSWGLDVLGRCTSIQIHTTPKTLLAGLWKSRKGQPEILSCFKSNGFIVISTMQRELTV